MTEESREPAGYEKADIEPWIAGIAGIILAVMLACVAVLSLLVLGSFTRTATFPPERLLRTTPLPPEPRLEVDPAHDLQMLRANEETLLSHYAWVDRKAGIVRIPISRAMDIIAERGLPSRPSKEEE